MMVTPDAPVNAVKAAQVSSEMTARPNGIQPNQARVRRSKRSDVLLSDNR